MMRLSGSNFCRIQHVSTGEAVPTEASLAARQLALRASRWPDCAGPAPANRNNVCCMIVAVLVGARTFAVNSRRATKWRSGHQHADLISVPGRR
jgi:hypothetical protein